MNEGNSPVPDAVMDLFVHCDDGSLPEIVLTYQDPGGVWRAVEELLKMSSDGLPDRITVWRADGSGAEQMTTGDAARAVCAGTFEAFHIVLGDLSLSCIGIPDLGVFVAPRDITIDYRQGDSWNPQNVAILLRWMGSTGAKISVPWHHREIAGINSILSRLAAG